MVDIQYTSPLSLGKRESLFSKRRRSEEPLYDETENTHPQISSYNCGHSEKRIRRSFGTSVIEDSDIDDIRFSKRDIQRLQQEYDNQMFQIRTDMQRCISEKNSEIESTRAALNSAIQSAQESQQMTTKLDEENKLFKRAISIQEGRYRDIFQQSHQLREALGQALEHIASLERINNNLREQLRHFNAPESIGNHHFLPPDIF